MSHYRSFIFSLSVVALAALVQPESSAGVGHETLTPGEATQVGMVSQWQLPLSISGGYDSIVDGKVHVDRSRFRVLYEVSVDGKVLIRVPADTLKVDNVNAATLVAAASGPKANEQNSGTANAPIKRKRDYEFVIGSDGSRQARIKGTDQVIWTEEKGGMRFPQRAGGPNDLPEDEKEAERLAKMEAYKLKRINKEAVVSRREVPQTRLYVLGKDGTLECHDAETGRTLWVARYGNSLVPTIGLSVTDDLVAFANGSNLFVVDSMTGKIATEYHLDSVPVTAPIIIGEYVMIACTNRKVEGYALNDIGGERFTAVAAGLPMAKATRAPGAERMMWATDSGFVYAIDGIGTPSLVFRFPADGLIAGEIAALTGERFYMASEKGQVYGISASMTGSMMWRQSLGEPVYAPTVVVGERVLVKTVSGRLFCFDANDGSMVWPTPVTQISKVLGGTKTQLFVRTRTEHLEAIDLETGSVNVEFFATNIVDAIENPYTDRLYLLTKTGTVQCLRPAESELPELMLSGAPAAKDPAKQEGKDNGQGDAGNQSDANQGADPFGLEDTMGNGNAPDPFGGADPFGGNSGGNVDPFGGGADDPFGGF